MSLTTEQKEFRLKLGNTAITGGISFLISNYITGDVKISALVAGGLSVEYFSNIENVGYYYGTKTGDHDKRSITYWFKTQNQIIQEQTGLIKGIDYDYIDDQGRFVKKASGFEGFIGSLADFIGIDRNWSPW